MRHFAGRRHSILSIYFQQVTDQSPRALGRVLYAYNSNRVSGVVRYKHPAQPKIGLSCWFAGRAKQLLRPPGARKMISGF